MLRPRRVHLLPPVSYQGAKQRLAPDICDWLALSEGHGFADLCCGSGAVSIEMLNRGAVEPEQITMVDAGPWGDVWRLVGAGEFDVDHFAGICSKVPNDLALVQDYLTGLSRLPVDADEPYIFLLLQAGAFGGKAVWTSQGRWVTPGMRSYWMPTAHSVRRSPVTPMKPGTSTLLERMTNLACAMRGVQGYRMDAREASLPANCKVYIDPPYANGAGYGHSLDARKTAGLLAPRPVYVSEALPLNASSKVLTRGRRAGGISGVRTEDAEYLSLFNADWPTPDYERAEQMSVFDA